MENVVTNIVTKEDLGVNVVLNKKLEGYVSSSDLHNFIAPQEITVTITISEYRDLVKRVATAQTDVDKANADKCKREDENRKLKEEVAELKAKLYELQNKEEKSDET